MDPVKKTVQSYNKFAKNYVESTFDIILQYQLTQFTSFLKGKKVLDAGAGSAAVGGKILINFDRESTSAPSSLSPVALLAW